MKKHFFQRVALLAGFALCFYVHRVNAQTLMGGNYSFTVSVPSNLVLPPGTKSNAAKGVSHADVPILKESYIQVLDVDTDNKLVYFKYWKFDDPAKEADYGNGKIFWLPLDRFNELTEPAYPRYKGVRAGAYTVPIRLRGTLSGDDFDFEPSLSLQTNIVFGWGSRRKQTSWFDLAIGVGLTGIELNSLNSSVTENRTATAFTLSTGGIFNFSEKVNLGIFIGKDWLSAKDRDTQFKYHGKLWLGIGINVPFTAATSDNTGEPGTN